MSTVRHHRWWSGIRQTLQHIERGCPHPCSQQLSGRGYPTLDVRQILVQRFGLIFVEHPNDSGNRLIRGPLIGNHHPPPQKRQDAVGLMGGNGSLLWGGGACQGTAGVPRPSQFAAIFEEYLDQRLTPKDMYSCTHRRTSNIEHCTMDEIHQQKSAGVPRTVHTRT